MDTLSEDLVRTEADTEMTMLTHEDIGGQDRDTRDEVEALRNSLREAVHDEAVRPKMQCLMMDASFSMVTMQGEDSGIEWETTPSRCTTPWTSEAGNPTVDFSSPVTVRPVTPGSLPAGKIIFVMDEQQISRRKKTKERPGEGKRKVDRQRELLSEDTDEISGRPELVGFSQPNVKIEGEEGKEEDTDPVVDKEQRLFSLVSEGSEILNIVVPPKLAMVDEEESKEMVDNLSYLQEIPLTKPCEETIDTDVNNQMLIQPQAPTGSGAVGSVPVRVSHAIVSNVMDPPGAPVARPPGRGTTGNVDYFEKFTLIDAHAPGSPAVVTEGQEELYAEGGGDGMKETVLSKGKTTTVAATMGKRTTEAISGEEIATELLDEVFYGGTDDVPVSALDKAEGCEAAQGVPSKFPLKESGSALFGSQEDILTPIFLPEGPPKIIDPILLEEPKAMAFLYTDLYEEAMGSRIKDEDTESMISEKSFHSRHSDKEARGYLEKYVLIDETPVVEMQPTVKEKCQKEGVRVLSEDSYNLDAFLSKPEKREMPHAEEEITDFFRSSANSSPCDAEPFPPSLEESDIQLKTKKHTKTKESVPQKAEKVVQPKITATNPTDPISASSDEIFFEEPDWGSADDHPAAHDRKDDGVSTDPKFGRQALETQKPVAPPRRKAASSPKTSLDLTPLTPVEVPEEKEEAGRKEQREEEKETASPEETADEGDGDGEETRRASSDVALIAEASATPEAETVKGKDTENETADRDTKPASGEGKDTETVKEEVTGSKTEKAKTQTGPEEVHSKSSEPAMTEVEPERQSDSLNESTREGQSPPAVVTEPAKGSGQCIIL